MLSTLFVPDSISSYSSSLHSSERNSQPPSIELDFSRIVQKLSHPKTKVVLFEAPEQGSKKSFMIELADYLEMEEIPFTTTNIYCAQDGDCDRLQRFAKSLDRYADVERIPTVILLDSGDDLYLWRRSVSPHLFDDLQKRRNSPRLGRSLNENDRLALRIYETCQTIIRTLHSPMFKVVMTHQKNRGVEDLEPTLHAIWREGFPYGSDIYI